MAGTLLLLREAAWDIHYMNVSSGNLGSLTFTPAKTARIRAGEAQASASLMQAVWHKPICHDLQVFYDDRTLRRLAAVVREVDPSIVLTHSPQDYMEDHMNCCRLAVTAAFSRGMPNFRTVPSRPAIPGDVTLYHAMPHGLKDGLRRRVVPGAWVNTMEVHATKRQALAAHRSQKEWLDVSQGMDSYLKAMDEMSAAVGRTSRRFRMAEGWRRHLHLGFSAAEVDPLAEALGRAYRVNQAYERALHQEI